MLRGGFRSDNRVALPSRGPVEMSTNAFHHQRHIGDAGGSLNHGNFTAIPGRFRLFRLSWSRLESLSTLIFCGRSLVNAVPSENRPSRIVLWKLMDVRANLDPCKTGICS
jgi:hypothetical protein